MPLEPAKLKTESLKLETVFNHLETKLYPILDFHERLKVKTNWDWIRDKLENVERAVHPTLKVDDLPKQPPPSELSRTMPESLHNLVQEEVVPELEGCTYPQEVLNGTMGADIIVGQDVVIWTTEKVDRCLNFSAI